MTAPSRAGGHWLDGYSARKLSDTALGAILVVVAALTIANVPGTPFARWDGLGAWFFPAVIAGLLAIVGLILLVRGSFAGYRQPSRWTLRGLVIAVSAVAAAILAVGQWGSQLALQFGPSEFATLIVFELTVAVGLARVSHLQAVGMTLLGLLLSTVGIDASTGMERLTIGFEELMDGISVTVAAFGLIVAADSAVCLVSPTLFLQTYARQLAGWATPAIPTIVRMVMRIAAALAMAAACVYAFGLNNSVWDIGGLLLFGAFGVACKIFGWNRLVLILALAWGSLLEENIRRAMLLSQGDPAIFLRWPFSATFLLLACGILAVLAILSARRALFPGRSTAA